MSVEQDDNGSVSAWAAGSYSVRDLMRLPALTQSRFPLQSLMLALMWAISALRVVMATGRRLATTGRREFNKGEKRIRKKEGEGKTN